WFVPSLMTISAGLVAALTLTLDASRRDLGIPAWLYDGSASSSRQILASLLASMVSVVGVVFSITIVALSFSSQSLGPRLLRNFMRHRFLQGVVGSFTATLLFTLTILASIDGNGPTAFVPLISVNLTLLATGGLVVLLIFFLHFVGISISADHVIEELEGAAQRTIETEWPDFDSPGESGEEPVADLDFPLEACIRATCCGYVLEIDWDQLRHRVEEVHGVVDMKVRAGDYVATGQEIATLRYRAPDFDPGELHRCVSLGPNRTESQDLEYRFHAIVEIAIRALSPGVNDPYTAITCIDKLSSLLANCAQRREPPHELRDDSGGLRVVRKIADFSDLMAVAWNQLRQHARGDVAVTLRLMEAQERLARLCRRGPRTRQIRRHAERIMENNLDSMPTRADERDLRIR
ncbi:MAG: DUF2254 domain-containing protein, partial [Salinibacterium sp.]|nr:DUF2254 domain-containing protein [Salinibacterium sp.]